ncbi:MAG: hypothetical protein JKY67_02670 [Pseudomonadales bacterium]|nr:hypothetical protein [Pseudomonadales bacterium]
MKSPMANHPYAQLLITFVLIFTSHAVFAATKSEVVGSLTYSHKMAPATPIDIGLELQGVKVESIYFSENMEALAILWNKTPMTVRPEIGVALFDKSGKLIGTGQSSAKFKSSSIRAGKQKNYTLQFDKFLNDYKNVAKFQLIFSIVEKKADSSKNSRDSDDGF